MSRIVRSWGNGPDFDSPARVSAPRLILASASPRRQELLREAGYVFLVHPADLDESDLPPGLAPGDVAEYLAGRKAAAVAGRFPDDVVLAADTVVALAGEVLGKPADADHARRMLARLSGTRHEAITGVAVVRPATGFARRVRVTSAVSMRSLSPAEVAAYVATGRWQGKAGGYGIQDHDPFVTRIAGSLTNIVGLPMDETAALLREAEVEST